MPAPDRVSPRRVTQRAALEANADIDISEAVVFPTGSGATPGRSWRPPSPVIVLLFFRETYRKDLTDDDDDNSNSRQIVESVQA